MTPRSVSPPQRWLAALLNIHAFFLPDLAIFLDFCIPISTFVKKQKHYFACKGPYSQSYGFSSRCTYNAIFWSKVKVTAPQTGIFVVGQHKRLIDAFKLWCWRRFFRVPWTARRSSNQSIPKEINPEYSLKRLMLKLKLQTLAT